MKPPKNGDRLVTIRKADGKTYVIVSGKLPSPYDSYTLVYFYDMTASISTWSRMKNVLFLSGFVLSGLLALGLLFVLKRVFRPLGKISRISKDIANGAYETRLPVSRNDELSEMASSFNHMADEIQCQITKLKDTADRKQQFVDNFAHELRTPLIAIYGYAEYMQKVALSESERLSALQYIMSESLLINLIDNAIKACGKKGHIIVCADEENGRKTLLVQDNGKGMTSEVISQITEPFYQGEKSRSRSGDGGAGLGLAICKQIVLSHNAELSFDSIPEEGTMVFQGLIQTVTAAEYNKTNTLPTKYVSYANQSSAAVQTSVPKGYKKANYTVKDSRLPFYKTQKPTSKDMSKKDAAKIGAQALWSVYRVDLEGKVIEMGYQPPTDDLPRSTWHGDVQRQMEYMKQLDQKDKQKKSKDSSNSISQTSDLFQ